jgi:hypothetical protein
MRAKIGGCIDYWGMCTNDTVSEVTKESLGSTGKNMNRYIDGDRGIEVDGRRNELGWDPRG